MENRYPPDWSVSIAGPWIAARCHVLGPKAMKGYFTPEEAIAFAVALIQYAAQADMNRANGEPEKNVGTVVP